jgi:hypothetical protein
MGITWLVVVSRFEGPKGFQDVSVFTDGQVVDIIYDHADAWWPKRFGFALSCEVVDIFSTQGSVSLVE